MKAGSARSVRSGTAAKDRQLLVGYHLYIRKSFSLRRRTEIMHMNSFLMNKKIGEGRGGYVNNYFMTPLAQLTER